MIKDELSAFLKAYEAACNSHDFAYVAPLIAEDASFWFSDGAHEGIGAIRAAFEKTWEKIQEEVYRITNVRWLIAEENYAVVTYTFHWRGKVNGVLKEGSGKGTNVLRKEDSWMIVHEHLSVVSSSKQFQQDSGLIP